MIGDILKELREDKGLTQEDLAAILKISRTSISMYESNTNEPSLTTLVAIADFFNVSTDYLLRRTKDTTFNAYSVDKDILKRKINKLLDEFHVKRKDHK